MNCLNDRELEDYISGRMPSERTLEAGLHIATCPDCNNRLLALPSCATAVHILGEQVINSPCPEYEELSAHLDGAVQAPRSEAIRLHASTCQLCAKDIETMQTLRSLARLRPTVSVSPDPVRRTPLWRLWAPKLVPAAGLAAAVIVVALVIAGRSGEQVRPAYRHQVSRRPSAPAGPTKQPSRPQSDERAPDQLPRVADRPVQVRPGTAPKPTVVAGIPRTDYAKLEAPTDVVKRIQNAVREKLLTGNLTADRAILLAMSGATDAVRRTADSSGPQPISPRSETVLLDDVALRWQPVEGAEEYRVELTDAEGKPVLLRQTSHAEVTIPQSDLPAEGGVLLWRVAARLGASDVWDPGKAAVVNVLSRKDSELVRKARSVYSRDHLVLGSIYEMYGLYGEAERQFQQLLTSPDRPANAQRMLSSLRAKRAR